MRRLAVLVVGFIAAACGSGESIPLISTEVTGGVPIPQPPESLGAPQPYVASNSREMFVFEVRNASEHWSVDEWSSGMADAAARADRLLAFYDRHMPVVGWEFVEGTSPSQDIGEGPFGSAVKDDARLWRRVAEEEGHQYVLVWTRIVGTPPAQYEFGWGPSEYLLELGFVFCPPMDVGACQNPNALLVPNP